jgi:hypothetical protein
MKAILKDKFHEVYNLDWWERESVFTCQGRQFSRKNIVLSMANKDGGAHVDKELEEYYKILISENWEVGFYGSLEFSGGTPSPQGETIYPENAHLALVRQFAHEVLCSSKHLKWLSVNDY